MTKVIKTSAVWDYDLKHDILLLKAKGREYGRSIEAGNLVIDVDAENFVSGLQIFDASVFLKTTKSSLRDLRGLRFESILQGNSLEIHLVFNVVVRNKVIEKNPIIVHSMSEALPDSRMVCEA